MNEGDNGTMTITEFLLARITEDEEREARAYQTNSRLLEGYTVTTDSLYPARVTLTLNSDKWHSTVMTLREFRERFTTPTPDKRMLAECAAKRAVVRRYESFYATRRANWTNPNYQGAMEELGFVLQQIAAVYADHPDYQQEWEARS